MTGSATVAIFEYQGVQRVVKEGGAVGPFEVGGIYPRRASVSWHGKKVFLPLVPEAPSPSPSPTVAREGSTEQWVRGVSTTQVVRNGAPVGLILRRAGSPPGSEGPLSRYGVNESDILKAVNGRPVRSEADLWWLHQELLHAPGVEISLERAGQDQTLRQELRH